MKIVIFNIIYKPLRNIIYKYLIYFFIRNN